MFCFWVFLFVFNFYRNEMAKFQALLFSVGRKSGCCSRIFCHYLPISQGRRAHRTKTIELINFDVVGSRGLECHRRRWIHQLLTRLSLLARRLSSLLPCERALVGVKLLLSSDVDLVFRRSGKHIIQFSVVLDGRDPVLGKSTDGLLLLGGRNRYDLKARLREQELLLGCGELGLVGGNGLAGCN